MKFSDALSEASPLSELAEETRVEKTNVFDTLLEGLKEGNRNDSFNKIGFELINDGVPHEKAFKLLRYINTTLSDPSPQSELESTIKSLSKVKPNPTIILDTTDPAEDIPKQTDDIEDEDFVGFGEVELTELKFYCEEFIPLSSVGMATGHSRSGKSVTIQSMIISGIFDLPFLGQFKIDADCVDRKVLMFSPETDYKEILRRIPRICKGLDIDIDDKEVADRIRRKFRIYKKTINREKQADLLKMLVDKVKIHKPCLVVLDSAMFFMPRNDVHYENLKLLMNDLLPYANKYTTTFLFLHHNRKNDNILLGEEGVMAASQFNIELIVDPEDQLSLQVIRKTKDYMDQETLFVRHTNSEDRSMYKLVLENSEDTYKKSADNNKVDENGQPLIISVTAEPTVEERQRMLKVIREKEERKKNE